MATASSSGGAGGTSGKTAYNSLKGALLGLTRVTAVELGLHGIRPSPLFCVPFQVQRDVSGFVSRKSRL